MLTLINLLFHSLDLGPNRSHMEKVPRTDVEKCLCKYSCKKNHFRIYPVEYTYTTHKSTGQSLQHLKLQVTPGDTRMGSAPPTSNHLNAQCGSYVDTNSLYNSLLKISKFV